MAYDNMYTEDGVNYESYDQPSSIPAPDMYTEDGINYEPYAQSSPTSFDPYSYDNSNDLTSNDYASQLLEQSNNMRTKRIQLNNQAEMKKNEMYRQGEVKYDSYGDPINDSNATIRAKEAANAVSSGADWLLEATENVADFGQGEWLDRAKFNANINGKSYDMGNKDIIGARDTSLEEMQQEYLSAEHDPMADKGIYTLRKQDGFNEDGSPKYIYKNGLAETSAYNRYPGHGQNIFDDGWELVNEKRFVGAEDWEKKWNALSDVLGERTLDAGGVVGPDGKYQSRDKASGIEFGSGKSEILNKDLLGIDTGTSGEYAEKLGYSKYLNDEAMKRTGSDSIIDAFQAGAVKTGVGLVDTVLDVVTPFGDNTWLNDYNKQEWVDKFVGYDRTQNSQRMHEAGKKWQQGDYAGSMFDFLTDPNTVAESIPMMIEMFLPLPTKFAKGAKLLDKTIEMGKAGKGAKAVAAYEDEVRSAFSPKQWKAYNDLKATPRKLKMFNHFGKNAGFHAATAQITNDVLNQRIEEKVKAGEPGEVGMGEVLAVYATQLPLMAMDKLAFKDIIKLPKAQQNVLREAFKTADKAGKTTILKSIGSKVADAGISMGEEGAQEYLQSWGEILGAKVGVNGATLGEMFTDEDNQFEALIGGLAGAGAGGQMHVATQAPGAAWKGIKEFSKDPITKNFEKISSIGDIGKTGDIISGDISDALVNEILVGGGAKFKDFSMDGTKSFNDVMDAMVSTYTKNIPPQDQSLEMVKGEFTQEVLSKALQQGYAALYDGDKKPIENVLKIIKNLNDDPKTNFLINDLKADVNDKLGEELSNIATKEYSASGIAEDLGLTVGDKNIDVNKLVDAEIQKKINADLDELGKRIGAEKLIQIMTKQGSVLDLGEDGTVQVDDSILADEENLSLLKLEEIIQKYKKQGDVKFADNVKDEITKFGFIEKVPIGKNGDGTTKYEYRHRPSMAKYNRKLKEQFSKTESLKTALTKETRSARSAGSVTNFSGWAESRFNKLRPQAKKVNGEIVEVPAKVSTAHVSNMEKENQWFKDKITYLNQKLKMHEVGKDKLPEETKKEIQAEINNAEESLINADTMMELHKDELVRWVKDEFGLEGFNWNNENHRNALGGVLTTLEKDSNGNEQFGDVSVHLYKGQELDDRMEAIEDRLTRGDDGLTYTSEPASQGSSSKQKKETSQKSNGRTNVSQLEFNSIIEERLELDKTYVKQRNNVSQYKKDLSQLNTNLAAAKRERRWSDVKEIQGDINTLNQQNKYDQNGVVMIKDRITKSLNREYNIVEDNEVDKESTLTETIKEQDAEEQTEPTEEEHKKSMNERKEQMVKRGRAYGKNKRYTQAHADAHANVIEKNFGKEARDIWVKSHDEAVAKQQETKSEPVSKTPVSKEDKENVKGFEYDTKDYFDESTDSNTNKPAETKEVGSNDLEPEEKEGNDNALSEIDEALKACKNKG